NATNLAAHALSASEVNLTWDLTDATDTAVVIERATSATGTYQVLAQLPGGENTYTDTSGWANRTYFYRVDTLTTGGATPFTSTVSATTRALPSAAAPTPSGLKVTANPPTTATVSFNAVTGANPGYLLERSDNGIA